MPPFPLCNAPAVRRTVLLTLARSHHHPWVRRPAHSGCALLRPPFSPGIVAWRWYRIPKMAALAASLRAARRRQPPKARRPPAALASAKLSPRVERAAHEGRRVHLEAEPLAPLAVLRERLRVHVLDHGKMARRGSEILPDRHHVAPLRRGRRSSTALTSSGVSPSPTIRPVLTTTLPRSAACLRTARDLS